jgi:hypothetical protein
MEALVVLGCVVIVLYVFFAMLRFTFGLIDRAHERLREEESRDAGMPLTEEQGG